MFTYQISDAPLPNLLQLHKLFPAESVVQASAHQKKKKVTNPSSARFSDLQLVHI